MRWRRHCPPVQLSLFTHTHTVRTVSLQKWKFNHFQHKWSFWVPPCLWRSVVDLSPRWPNFDPRSAHMRFMVDKVALWQSFSPSTSVFPLSVSFHQSSILTSILHVALSRTNERSLGTFQKSNSVWEIREHWIQAYFHIAFKSFMFMVPCSLVIQGGSNMTGTDVCKQAALRSSCATLREWSHNLHPPSCSG